MWAYFVAAAVFTAAPQNIPGCPLANQKPMLVTEFFFGRDAGPAGQVTDADWNAFARGTIAKYFPDGFTVTDGEGRWLDPSTRRVVSEQSKIVIAAARGGAGLSKRIEAVIDAYKVRFHQKSVGVLTTTECGKF